MEGYLTFKKGPLRFWKAEMKKYYFVLTHNPTNADLKYVLTWYKDDTKSKLKGTLTIPASMHITSGEHKQFFLGYYFQIRCDDNDSFHFSTDTKDYLERWISKLREATLYDVYAGITKANKFKEQSIINIYLTNNCIAFVHPITEETLLSWKLSQIVSFVFDQSEFSFVICSKCSKCAGRFTQEVTLQTSILIIGTMEDRISSLYADIPGAVITHEKNISGDVYRVPHMCRRIMETKQEILQNSSLKTPKINNGYTGSPNTFSMPRNGRANSLGTQNQNYIRSLNSSPVNHSKIAMISPGRNVNIETGKYSSLSLSSHPRIGTPVLDTFKPNVSNFKKSLDETKNWHSNSYSHTHKQTIRQPCLAEIQFPDTYMPKNSHLKFAASLENLDVASNSNRTPLLTSQSKWQQLSSADTSDMSEILSQSNYSSSPYSSSAGQSNHSLSHQLNPAQINNLKIQQDFSKANSLPRNLSSLPVQGVRCGIEQFVREPSSGRGHGTDQRLNPLRYQLIDRVTDSEHLYSIPDVHSKSMELLNLPANSSTNTSSSEYYEPMKSSVGVRHKPKHINTNRTCKNRIVRKQIKRENPQSNSSNCSLTSESSGRSSLSTDEGIMLNANRVYF
ncbi:hypothetical protein LOD99_10346 [Oopsacas minuta]|uniref:PH domain-containing protein n=1 Tax=Oopsacas minuta TaxID=111878 RepID=A0AAV7KGX3_9METZ|nr:hypothetical protein LOD99_10346 [Oopsacas minuta]